MYSQDYAERVLASFAHQIQYEYYGNQYVSIEGITLEHCSVKSSSYFNSFKHHSVFQPFLLDNRKHDAVLKNVHSKQVIELLKKLKIFFWSDYYMGEYRLMCRALHMLYSIVLIVNIVAGLLYSY